ncbi:MAG: hypothetical protein Q9187_001655, partial [Circinaria calcarea]
FYLLSPRALPIRLISPFATSIVASYNLVNETTEKYTAPHSLLFDTYASQGNTFFAGSDSEVCVFDVGRNGSGPVSRMPTIPSKRKKAVGGGVGMKGIISTLGMSGEGILAAGTFSRWVGLYDSGGRGGTVGVFELQSHKPSPTLSASSNEHEGQGTGKGITQLLWSPCARYLCAAERGTDGLGVWDIRGTGRRLAWLAGRKAKTMQRLGVHVTEGGEVWAGGTDGVVKVWESLGRREGSVDADWGFKAHEDVVVGVGVHPAGSVLASCSGQRRYTGEVGSRGLESEGRGSGSGSGSDSSASSSSSSSSERGSSMEAEAEHEPEPDGRRWQMEVERASEAAGLAVSLEISLGERAPSRISKPSYAKPSTTSSTSTAQFKFISSSFGHSASNRMTTALKSIKSLAPLLDRILVQRIKAETKTAGGIFLPESAVKELNEAKVLAVGPGGLDKEGKRVTPSVAPGDKVLIPQYGGSPVKVGDEEYALFRDHELLAKINE